MTNAAYISIVAGMSERITSLRTTDEAMLYFAEQFNLLFHLDYCSLYRVSEKKDVFIRSAECKIKKKSVPIAKPENRIQLPVSILDAKDKYVFINQDDRPFLFGKKIEQLAAEVIVTIRRAGNIELIFYGTSFTPIEEDAFQNDTCRIFSNFFWQVEDALLIRSKINDKQKELSGHIAENNDTLFQLNEKLITYNQELQQFAYSASHDLQEPLRTIASYINLFLKSYGATLTEEGKEYLQFASDGAQRMHHLIKDLLTYSKLDFQSEPMTHFEGNAAIRQALDNLQMSVEESNALILYPDLPVIYGNHSQIILLFQNLIDNAIKFRSKNEPLVFIDLEELTDRWEFKVKDNGIGIAQQFQQKIFGIFNRLHGRDEIQGSGLGLSICKKIVERHRGEIAVESKPGKGTTFIFSIGK
ncbi:MAG TPA: ATP-binding protein [Chitinophagales bacterium]|nr:ATP-binding protein [Chitinophagales bacterium]